MEKIEFLTKQEGTVLIMWTFGQKKEVGTSMHVSFAGFTHVRLIKEGLQFLELILLDTTQGRTHVKQNVCVAEAVNTYLYLHYD